MGKNRIASSAPVSRRAALKRLAGAALAGYVVPEIMFLSAARAEGTAPTPPTAPSTPEPTPPAPSSAPETPDPENAEDAKRETCGVGTRAEDAGISISRTDLERAKAAVEAGRAAPLDQIWGNFVSNYRGKVIGIEFLDSRQSPRYRFRAISRSGRLETVTISAQTGDIIRIVGC